jgi:hypothetical protein
MSPTAGENAKNFRLYFTNYVNIDSITTIGRKTLGIIVFDFVGWPYLSPDNVIENNNNDFFIQIYPNPAKDYVELVINIMNHQINLLNRNFDYINIYNIMGEKIQFKFLNNEQLNENQFKVKIDISNFNTGIYYITYINHCRKLNVIR